MPCAAAIRRRRLPAGSFNNGDADCRRDEAPIVPLLEKQHREDNCQETPAKRRLRRVVHRLHRAPVGPQRCGRQTSAETFQHYVAGEQPERRTGDGERQRDGGGGHSEIAVAEHASRDQRNEHDGQHPTDQARYDSEPVIDSADEQHGGKDESVNRGPNLRLEDFIEEPNRVRGADGERQVLAESVMLAAIVIIVAPKQVGLRIGADKHDDGGRYGDGYHRDREQPLDSVVLRIQGLYLVGSNSPPSGSASSGRAGARNDRARTPLNLFCPTKACGRRIHATPARSRSWKCTMPTGRPFSTTMRAVIFNALINCSASLAS